MCPGGSGEAKVSILFSLSPLWSAWSNSTQVRVETQWQGQLVESGAKQRSWPTGAYVWHGSPWHRLRCIYKAWMWKSPFSLEKGGSTQKVEATWVTRWNFLLFIVCVLAGDVHVRAGFQLVRQEGGAAGRALRVRQGMTAARREGAGIQLGLQDFNHFLLLLQLPAKPSEVKEDNRGSQNHWMS